MAVQAVMHGIKTKALLVHAMKAIMDPIKADARAGLATLYVLER